MIMENLNINDKVSAIASHYQYHVLQMKVGGIGVIIDFTTDKHTIRSKPHTKTIERPCAVVRLNNGDKVVVPMENLKPYEKKKVIKIEDLGNAELLEGYGAIVRDEQHGSTKTKAYQKRLNDMARYEAELLKRLNTQSEKGN